MHPEHKSLRDNYYPLLAEIIVRDDYICARCGAFRPLVVDHIVSVKEGGVTLPENLQLLCKGCNRIKASTTADYRPRDRGALGLRHPRYSINNRLLLRTYTYRYGRNEGFYVQEYEYIELRGRERIRLAVPGAARDFSNHLRTIYPPDLQYIY